jgi:DNA-binding transcriptional ArsR family regulator
MLSTWTVLADPHRRAAIELLAQRPRLVGELASELGLTQPATSKHLRVLRDAELVTVSSDGPRRVYALRALPLAEIDSWIEPYRAMWSDSLDALETHLNRLTEEA